MTTLQKIKILLNLSDTSKDNILNLLIDNATEFIQNYIHDTDISSAQNILVQMVIYNYNRMGTEGLNSEGYSGLSYSYLNEYPDTIIGALKPLRKLRTF